jgi:SAM-dependent methyltransferase
MTFSLETIVPWGRSFAEYVAMFDLSEADLDRRILGCGDGPAAFNSELSRQGGQVVSVDPLYQFSAAEIQTRIGLTFDQVMAKVHQNQQAFVWKTITSPGQLGQLRMAAMGQFLADYRRGKVSGRYLEASVLALPFSDRSFELALCSHLLFLYSDQLDQAFHLAAIAEMLRVAAEVRIFPLLALSGQRSRHLEAVLSKAQAQGWTAEVLPVGYEFQKGGNQMLRLTA